MTTEATTTSPVALQVDQLAAGYGDLRAVWDVSLRVEAGKVTSLLGSNGAGKSTTLLSIMGLARTMGGTIRLSGEDIGGLTTYERVRQGIGFVQEGKRLFRQRTVEQNLLLGGWTISRPRRRRLNTALEHAYARFPILAEKRKQPAGALSGGQQQMLAIAQALIPEPRVLLLDEPSVGLAPIVTTEVMNTISQLRAEGIAVLLVEQVLDAALSVADDVIVIARGRMSWSGTRIEATDRQQIIDAFMASHPTDSASPQADAERGSL